MKDKLKQALALLYETHAEMQQESLDYYQKYDEEPDGTQPGNSNHLGNLYCDLAAAMVTTCLSVEDKIQWLEGIEKITNKETHD